MRVLVTVQPQMYREALALALQNHRSDAEVMLDSVPFPDSGADGFRPHLLVRNDTDGADMGLHSDTLCWIEILYSDGMDARISLDGKVWEISDINMEDLLALVDRTENLIPAQKSG